MTKKIKGYGLVPLIALVALVATILVGCVAPPTSVEQAVFDIKTNYVPVVVHQTNYVPVTNISTIYITNDVNHVIEIPQIVVTARTNVTTLTNVYETTEWTVKTNIAAATGTTGAIINTFVPGLGTLLTAILTGLLGVWGTARHKNAQVSTATNTAAALAQVIEVGRNILINTPQGSKAAEAWKNWMIQHQVEQGVLENVIILLDQAVDTPQAKEIAAKLLKLQQEIKGGTA